MPSRVRPAGAILIAFVALATQALVWMGLMGVWVLVRIVQHLPPGPKLIFTLPWTAAVLTTSYLGLLLTARKMGKVGFAGCWAGQGSPLLLVPIAGMVFGSLPWSAQAVLLLRRMLPNLHWFEHHNHDFVHHPVAMLILLCLIAPVFEELLFRGWILRGLLETTTPARAIAISTVLFALVHGNPFQMPVALFVGSISAWIFFRTRSLLLCMGAHAMNNAVAGLAGLLTVHAHPSNGSLMPWPLLVGGLVVYLSSAAWFDARTPPRATRSPPELPPALAPTS